VPTVAPALAVTAIPAGVSVSTSVISLVDALKYTTSPNANAVASVAPIS